MDNLFQTSLFAGVTVSLVAYLLGMLLKKKFKLAMLFWTLLHSPIIQWKKAIKKNRILSRLSRLFTENNNFCIIRTLVGLCISITVVMIREMQITWADLLIHLTRVSGLLPGKLTGL